jgi:nickel/cobalt transporter (NiCoT) family protein
MTTQSASPVVPSRRRRMQAALTPPERRRAAALAAAIVGLHALGFFILLVLVVPHGFSLGGAGVFGVGLGLTAYTLGLRHAFDADHVGAIDNTTRKLMADGQRPLSVGFWFSLGHSTVVFALAVLIVIGVRGLGGELRSDGSWLHQATGVVGPLVSGSFLLLIGLVNLALLASIVRVARRLRHGELDERELEQALASRGAMTRVYRRATRTVRTPRQMYPLGVLFGLGFDTATEVALLVLAGGAALSGLPFYAILCLPILFAAGMSLLDTLDGACMCFAYDWAFSRPVRKVYYNLTVTGLSVAVALLVGTVELLSVLGLDGGLDLDAVGYVVVGMFLATWAAALAIWRFGRVEERWSARLGPQIFTGDSAGAR